MLRGPSRLRGRVDDLEHGLLLSCHEEPVLFLFQGHDVVRPVGSEGGGKERCLSRVRFS